MENKNSLILGLIRKLTDYADYPHEISSDTIASIFSEKKNYTDSFVSPEKTDFYAYAYNKICINPQTFKNILPESDIVYLENNHTYKSLFYASWKMGLNLLFTAHYNGNQYPGIFMSLFMRLLIEKIFQPSFPTMEKNKYQPDSFHDKIIELFEEANHLNYELAVCAIEPYWAKMTFYSNCITMYYCSKETSSAVAINSKYTSLPPKTQIHEKFKTFHIDYIKNSIFYLPSFAIEKDDSLQSFVFRFREALSEISKLDLHKQKKEIQALFHSVSPEHQQHFNSNAILIFKA
ncbi:MAG: hypothetical protein RMJ87_08505 [Cytophagales bacterium]|nr:hypothetical protein [Cytophagales bacterium]